MKIEKEKMLFMKKSIKTTLLGSAAVLMSVSLAACGNSSASKSTKKTTTPKTEKVQSKKSSTSSATSAAESSAVSSSSASSSSTVSAQNLTPQQMGILLAMDQEPDILGGSDGSALPLWYGVVNNNDGSSDDTVGYNYFTTHGDGTADIYWKVNGNMVTFKRLDPNSGDCVADEKMMTKTIPVSELIQKYYSTPQQQSQVNNAANQMQPQNN